MELKEEEFNLAKLLEDEVVDFFHPAAMKKEVDVILDLCHDDNHGSILKFSQVKGDKAKLQQILWNLLSNAVKFTEKGRYISVRAWVKKPSFEQSILISQQNSFLSRFLCWFSKEKEEAMETVMKTFDPKTMEFVFEVEDCGPGISKEKQKFVFENYNQVKESAKEHGGTGLGLGIVQTLVRLMGGEIAIVDKKNGERGTCFRFNIFLTTNNTNESTVLFGTHQNNHDDIEMQGNAASGFMNFHSPTSSRCNDGSSSSHVVLLIQSDERRRVVCKMMESLGIKVSVAKKWENLAHILKKIKRKRHLSHYSSSGKSDWSTKSEKLSSNNSAAHNSSFVLMVIDTGSGPFNEIYKVVFDFKNDLIENKNSRVVWLNNPLQDHEFVLSCSSNDQIMSKPLHGSRLYQVIRLLPEFGGSIPLDQGEKSISPVHVRTRSRTPRDESTSGGEEIKSAKKVSFLKGLCNQKENDDDVGGEKLLLNGKKVLIVEDNSMLRKIAKTILSQFGAIVEDCVNGKEAFDLVCKGLEEQNLPYDYIFMDCEMPIMNGFEATTLIREEEKKYGVHIPIIALTAHSEGEETQQMMQAGIDFLVTKPLKKEKLEAAMAFIHGNVA